MPVVFAAPDPVAPQISSAYGAAQQFSQDFPTLERQQQSIASAYENARNMQFHANQANADRQQANLAQSAHNTMQAEMFNQGQEQQQQQYIQSRQPSERDAFQAQAQMAENAQRADLQNWLGQQDLSQKEQMRLQQINSHIGDIEAARGKSLTNEQADEALLQAKGIEGPLTQRLKASQARQLESHAKLNESQQKLEAQKIAITAKVASSSKEDQTKTEVDPNFEAQANAELGPVQPTGSMQGDVQALQQRQALIRQKAGAAGKLVTSRMQKDGTWQPDKPVAAEKPVKEEHPSGYTAEQYRKEYSDANKRIKKIADSEKELTNSDGSKVWTSKKIQEETEKDMIDQHLPANITEYHAMTPVGKSRGPAPAPAPAPQPVGTPAPASAPPPEVAFATSRAALQERTDLPPDVRGRVLTNLDTDLGLINEAGGFKNLGKSTQEAIIKRGLEVEQVLKMPKPQPAAPSAPSEKSLPDGNKMWRNNRLHRLP